MNWPLTSVLLFLGLRLTLLVVVPAEALFGYGDFFHYYQMAAWSFAGHCPAGPDACWPLLDFWYEFPPIFPYLSAGVARLVGGSAPPTFHGYAYAIALVLLVVDLGNLLLVRRLAQKLHGPATADWLTLVYALLPSLLPLSWWTFDGLTTLWMLLGLWSVLERRDGVGALAVGLGGLTKLLPVLVLPVVWRARPFRRAALVTAGAAAVVVVVLGPFLWRSPAMALASLRSQFSKSSYASVWAMVDGNLQTADGQPVTGNFGGLADRFDARLANVPLHQPARLPGWAALSLVGGVYAAVWLGTWRRRPVWSDQQTVTLFAFTWAIFLLWSKGWSPQWQQMLAPLILLTMPDRMGVLFALMLASVSFLEWPLLLSRGWAWGYWLTIPLRTSLFAGWAVAAGRALLAHAPVRPQRVPN